MMFCPYCSQPIPDQLIRVYEGHYSIRQLELTCPSISCRTVTYIATSSENSVETLRAKLKKLEEVKE